MHVLDDLDVGGAQRLVLTYARQVVPTGTPVTVVSLRRPRDDVLADGLRAVGAEVLVLSPRTTSSAWTAALRLVALVRTLRRLRPRAVQTHLLYANVLGAVSGRICRVPVIATLHSARVGGDGNSGRALALERAVLRSLPVALVAVGTRVEQAQRERFAPRRITVVNNAVERGVVLAADQRRSLRRSLGLDDSVPLVVAVGRLDPAKGYSDLLDAFRRVCDADPLPVLAIAGEGPLHRALRERIADEGLQGRVLLLGGRDDVRELLAVADVYVGASHWEGLPVALLEGMAAGLPVVMTAVGDVPSVVDDTCGVLVPPHDPSALAAALLGLLRAPDRRQALGRESRRRVAEDYDVEQWVAALHRVHAGGGPGATGPTR